MGTVLTVIAGLLLAGAATAGVVATQDSGPSGTPDTSITSTDPAVAYDAGQ